MERRAIAVQGIVQGVGFRPFVYGLASRHRLRGFVKNHTGGVLIEVEGHGRANERLTGHQLDAEAGRELEGCQRLVRLLGREPIAGL